MSANRDIDDDNKEIKYDDSLNFEENTMNLLREQMRKDLKKDVRQKLEIEKENSQISSHIDEEFSDEVIDIMVDRQVEQLFPQTSQSEEPLKEKSEKSGCFIATATYDSYNSSEVLLLRKWRDNILLKSTSGKLFVNFYYTVSPYIAKTIKKSYFLKMVSKSLLNIFIKLFNK